MPATARPLSPHISIYHWYINMVCSILHRATGIALAAGTLLLLAMLLALASGPDAWGVFTTFCRSWIGLVLLFGWSWALSFHLLNGIRHLLQDYGWGYQIPQIVRNGFLVVIGSGALTLAIWACAWFKGDFA